MRSDPFDLGNPTAPDLLSGRLVAERAAQVLRPLGSLARLDEVATWLAEWQRTSRPSVDRPAALLFAGDHGVAGEGVSAYPSSVTRSVVDALEAGAGTAAVMAKRLGVTLEVVDVGVGRPSGNIRREPALTVDQFRTAIDIGRSAVVAAGDVDLLILGEVGIGNTTPASAISLALFGGTAEEWVGPGTGLDRAGVLAKTAVVSEAVARAQTREPGEVLRQLGGWELAAIAGAAIQARDDSIPVLLDGFVVTSALMPLEVAHPGFLDHCWPSHVSGEPGHGRLVQILGRRPLLDLGLRLGEGSGALAALPIVDLAARALVDVATFEEWGLA